MLLHLHHRIRFSRSACVASALLCFALAVVFTPVRARSQLTPAAPAPLTAAITAPAIVKPVVPIRDAFVPRAPIDDDLPAQPQRISLPLLPVPAGPATAIRQPAQSIRVSALATGEHPIAIVDVSGTTKTLTIGDALAGSTVSSIERDAVVLANGKRLSLEAGEATP